MQTGVIDAVEWVGPYNDRTLGLMEVGDYYYYPGWHEPGAMLETIVNAEALASLPEDLQAIVRVAARRPTPICWMISPPTTASLCRFCSPSLRPSAAATRRCHGRAV
ncbi:MAG: hypothetical protein CM15mP25_1710 [Gammaproteobacteria bacterium]|nr:MAG: hypothetical protein CM15mP25_1710 [Gammaproteobacteria bacterium]